jgi:hypothetical protein
MASGRFVLLLAILLGFVWQISPAQQTPAASGIPVHMVITAQALHSDSPPAISREDVMVYEGRDRDKVTDWLPAEGDHARLELFVFIDDSSNASLGSQLEDLRHFMNAQPSTAKIGVAYMQNGSAQILQNLNADHAQAAKALRLPLGIPGGNASPYFALEDLLKRWPETASDSRREVIIVSDGIDRFWGSGPDDPYVSEVIEHAQRAGVLVFCIYTPGTGFYASNSWRAWWGQMYLSRVAAETGGESYYIGFNGAPVSFVPYLDEISHRLSHQYLLTFLAKPGKKARMRRVKVTTEVPKIELVGADNVYVPAGSE